MISHFTIDDIHRDVFFPQSLFIVLYSTTYTVHRTVFYHRRYSSRWTLPHIHLSFFTLPQVLFIVLFAIFVDYDYGADARHDIDLLSEPGEVSGVQLDNNRMASKWFHCLFDDVIRWKHPRYLALSEGNPPVTIGFPHRGSITWNIDWTNGWTKSGVAGGLGHHDAHMTSPWCPCTALTIFSCRWNVEVWTKWSLYWQNITEMCF